MPRIRTIKPEFWTDAKIMELSMPARLLFLGLISHADDYGNQDASIKQTRARIFPADSVDLESCIEELKAQGLLMEYSSSGRQYWNIVNFRKHQKINRPSGPRCPAPDRTSLIEDSSRTHGTLPEGSGSGSGSRIKDLPPDAGSLREPAPASEEQVKISRPKDLCTHESCTRRGSVRINTRWYCTQHSPDRPDQPEQALNLAGLLTDAEKFLRP